MDSRVRRRLPLAAALVLALAFLVAAVGWRASRHTVDAAPVSAPAPAPDARATTPTPTRTPTPAVPALRPAGVPAATNDPAGAQLFLQAGCGGCHTFRAAGTHGTVGPNLDELAPDTTTVVRQVTSGGNGMPGFGGKLTVAQIQAIGLFVSHAAHRISVRFTPTREKVSDCLTGDLECLRQAFGNVAYYEGPKAALAKLDAMQSRNVTLAGLCHQITHAIGHAAFERYHGNAALALANGLMTCASGYYHGVVERAFAGVPRAKVVGVARGLCSARAVQANSFLLYQCIHGLGHGLMIWSQNDLPAALRICDSLDTRRHQRWCTGGVFMQDFLPGAMATMGMAPSKWLKADDLLYPCDAVATKDKLYCFFMVGSNRLAQATNYDWAAASSWCRRAGAEWERFCFQSIGYAAADAANNEGTAALRFCAAAGDMARECVYGAARNVANAHAGGAVAAAMCARAATGIRAYCFEGVGAVLSGLTTTVAAGDRACDGVTPAAYRDDCRKGVDGRARRDIPQLPPGA